ncbi:hypothetical protein F5Y03DRAFT_402337 [Xylaria venustula]|nr:hypothetical protein F5Y03DRAFT_402337 [Xylaria venustula]
MFGFMRYFDCLFGRRIAEILTGRAEDEPNSVPRELPSEGYKLEPVPTAGDLSQTSSSRHQNAPCSCPCRTTNTYNRTDLAALDLATRDEYPPRYSQLKRMTPMGRRGLFDFHSTRPIWHSRLGRYDLNVFHNGGIENHPVASPSRGIGWRDMRVIEALWHCGIPGPRETDWSDLKQTMGNLGFAFEPGNGKSKFRASKPSDFLPVELIGKSIPAHRPHGKRTALSLHEMRDIGRRMTDTLGWTAETFKDMF